MKKLWPVLLALGLGAPCAQAMQINDNLSIGGNVWVMYRNETTSNNPANKVGMDVDEAELDINYKLDETWDTTMSFLMGRWAGANDTGVGFFFIRQGYLNGKNLWHEGSHLRIGLQGSPWHMNVEKAWGMNWLDGYTVGQQDPGFIHRWENGVRAGGNMGMLSYDVFYHTGNGFNSNGINSDNAMNWTAQVGVMPMEGLKITAQYLMAGDYTYGNKVGGNTMSAAVMFKQPGGVVDVLAEYHSSTGKCADKTGCTGYSGLWNAGAKAGANNFSATAYALHLNAHFTEKVGLWARYVTGNDDFVNILKGVKYGQWEPSYVAGDVVKARTSIGPTYTFVKDKYFGALVYETGTLSDASTSKVAGTFSSVSAIRANFAAFF